MLKNKADFGKPQYGNHRITCIAVFLLVSFILTACSGDIVKTITVGDTGEVYVHDVDTFTQGLFVDDGVLYESSGLSGKSYMYRYDNGLKVDFQDVFLEGCVMLDDTIYLLTYQDNAAYVVDKDTFEIKKSYYYDREGWGLTTDGKYLIASDGTPTLYFMDKDFNLVSTIDVYKDGYLRDNINELEYINGYIFANIWHTNTIVAIDPVSGNVVSSVNVVFDGQDKPDSVLNGIAFDGNSVYLTGKFYDELWVLPSDRFMRFFSL